MSVIVTGMDMPGICGDCPSYDWKKHKPDGKYCKAKIYEDSRNPCYDDCPLKSVEGLIEQIESFAKKQEQIAFAVSNLNERYTHLQKENAYRHCLQVIKEYCEEGAVG